MALGLCCHWLNKQGKNTIISKSLRLGKYRQGHYTKSDIRKVYQANLENLERGIRTVIEAGIRSFRISSSLFPLFDLVPSVFWNSDSRKEKMDRIGKLILDNGLRVTTHPGQFVVLSSDNPDTVSMAIREIEHYAWFFDTMNLPRTPYYSINVHGGKSNRAKALIENIGRLNDSARKRLTLENCEFAYSVSELLPISKETNVPICFDSHHHVFNDGDLSQREALEASMDTWGEHKPNTHVSNTKECYVSSSKTSQLRQHSDYIYSIPEAQKALLHEGCIDIDIEAKKKNHAIFKLCKEFNISLD